MKSIRTVNACAVVAFAAAVFSALPLAAQEVELSGQVRIRTEYRDVTAGETITSMRARLAGAVERGKFSAFVQFQDVRLWGEETNTSGDFVADAIDLHQGWIEWRFSDEHRARFGRQEVVYGGQRLVGSLDWAQQGRSFDGARFSFDASETFDLDLFGFQLLDAASPATDTDAAFWGAYGVWNAGEGRTLDLFALHQNAAAPLADTKQWTTGFRYAASTGDFSYRAEAAMQTGERLGTDVSAYMAGLRVGKSFDEGRGSITLWGDILSGNEAGDTDIGAFETLYATNHKYYGYADLFLNIPVDTDGRGLVDLAVKTQFPLGENYRINVDLHRFQVAEDDGLSTGHLGEEIDVTFGRSFGGGVGMSGGFAWVMAGDALLPVRGIDDDVLFGYLMLSMGF